MSGEQSPAPAQAPTPEKRPALGLRTLLGAVKTMRPHQWVKNIFVLAPVVFAKEIFDESLLLNAAAAFVIFCLIAGAVYTINDLADVDADRRHPVKRYRPIPSGDVPIPLARALAVALIVGALGWAGLGMGNWPFFAVAAGYLALNLAYSLKLKHVAYLDVGCIAAGFVLRVLGGGVATATPVSFYLFACTALLALFLGFGKRRHELAGSENAEQQRAALEGYSMRGLNVALGLTGVATLAAYLGYTLAPETETFFQTRLLWPTTAFVALALLRFLHLVRNRPHAESPTQEMLRDGPFVAIVLGWAVVMAGIIYRLQPS